MRKPIYIIRCMVIACVSVLMLTGCRKDLCYNHDEHALTTKAAVSFDWEQEWERDYGADWSSNWKNEWNINYDDLRPEIASGIHAIVYHPDNTRFDATIPVEGDIIPTLVWNTCPKFEEQNVVKLF